MYILLRLLLLLLDLLLVLLLLLRLLLVLLLLLRLIRLLHLLHILRLSRLSRLSRLPLMLCACASTARHLTTTLRCAAQGNVLDITAPANSAQVRCSRSTHGLSPTRWP